MNIPTNTDDIIDSRDVIESLDEDNEWALMGGEKMLLQAFHQEGESATDDWEHGACCIRDSYFSEYAQQLAEELGATHPMNGTVNWPLYCIDWEWAARELQMDYTPIEFAGVTYWVR